MRCAAGCRANCGGSRDKQRKVPVEEEEVI